MALGITIGLLAAYSRGKLDDVLMRTMDVFISLPQIVFALVLAATVGPKLWLLIVAVGLTMMPRAARITRGAAAEVVERDYVRAAEAIGIPRRKIILSELLPNVSSPLIAETTLRMSFNVAVVAGLSFLGFQAAAAGRRLGPDDQREPERLDPPALAGSPPRHRHRAAYDRDEPGRGLPRSSCDRHRTRQDGRRMTSPLALEVVDLRVEIEYGTTRTSSTASPSASGPARCSVSSGSRARARRRSASRYWDTRPRARVAHGEVRIEGRDILLLPR